ncbi:MAG TPA: ABC transporter substrate-binding protein [Acidimicrobiia bacterium]
MEVDSLRDKTFRTIGATAVLLGIAVAALAQAGPGQEAPTEIAVPEATRGASLDTVSPSTTVGEPFRYRVGLLAGISTDNFWEYIGAQPTAWNAYVLGPTKPALYGIDPDGSELIPDLATGEGPPAPTHGVDVWQVRIELGQHLTWSDGEPVSALDVVYTFETARRLGLEGGWGEAFGPQVEAIVAESATELRIEFSEQPGLGVWPYGIGLAPIMPAHVWAPRTAAIDNAADLYGLDGAGDVSGGPLQITAITGKLIEAEANPGYPGTGPAGVSYTVFSDEAAAVAAMKSGDIDAILDPNGLSEAGSAALDGADGITVERSPANSVRYLGFNLTRAPMSEPAFRRSLALLLDREDIADDLLPGGEAAYTMLSPANEPWFDQVRAESIAGPYREDIAARLESALSLLQSAGYEWEAAPTLVDGSLAQAVGLTIAGAAPAPLTILTPGDEYDPARHDYTERIEATLELLGFDVRPVVTDFDTVVDLAFSQDEAGARQYDMYVLGWTLGSPVRPDYYRWLFATDGVANSTGYSNQELDALLTGYQGASDPTRARAAVWDMEQILARDLPYLVLYHPDIVEGYRSDRLRFGEHAVLGGIQGRLGGLADLRPAP